MARSLSSFSVTAAGCPLLGRTSICSGEPSLRATQSAVPATPAMVVGVMMRSVRKLVIVATVAMTVATAALTSLGLSGAPAAARFTVQTSRTASTTTSVPIVPVKVQVVAKGQFSGLVSGRDWLYSVQLPQRGSQLARAMVVRLDPASGHIVARSVVLPGASSPAFVDNALWLMAGLSKGRGLPTELVALNPLTLQRERSVPVNSSLASGSLDSLTGSGRGPLWAAFGCKLLRLNPESGQVLQAVKVPAGTQCELAMDNETNRFLVEVGPTALRGQPPAPTLLLQERNGSNGRLLGSAIIPNPPSGWDWLSAYDGNVWLSGGDPGTCGSIYDYRTSPLRLFASSYGQECRRPARGSRWWAWRGPSAHKSISPGRYLRWHGLGGERWWRRLLQPPHGAV